FARIVEEHGLIFIGPKADHIALMGDKIQAKKTAAEIGLPLTPGSDGALTSFEHAEKTAKEIGYPVLIKAASGGGGKGMKVAKTPSDLEEAYAMARIEANANFGNDVVYMERYLAAPRHIEVQVIGDHHGNVVQLGERDCSIQRRHQKIWEEAPSPALTPEARDQLGGLVQKAMKKMGYFSAGTLEFLFEEGSFYFIEMNTRLQVEHPITEMITGIDLMQEQIRVAAGLPLSFTQEDVSWSGHAIECRINAENPETFLPSPGTVTAYLPPGGFRVRVDSPLYAGYKIPPYYDSLIAKLIVHGSDRSDCLKRLRRALQEYVIVGPETLLPLHRKLSLEPAIEKGEYTIHWLEDFLHSSQQSPTE
ncbi:MAG: ATP-grasp domain-containing protein, partial [Holosporales bacterium]